MAEHVADRTQAPYLALPVFSQLTIAFFFPDYRLSACARIPFLTHQNGDIHLKDDICGEFLNNLIVIRHRRGYGGGLWWWGIGDYDISNAKTLLGGCEAVVHKVQIW